MQQEDKKPDPSPPEEREERPDEPCHQSPPNYDEDADAGEFDPGDRGTGIIVSPDNWDDPWDKPRG